MYKKFGRFRHGCHGSTAVEFAMIAPLFFAIILSILEAGWFLLAVASVQHATDNAARLIRTGNAQAGISRDGFYDIICDTVKFFGACDETLTVAIDRYANFNALATDASAPICHDSTGPAIEGAQFDETDYGGGAEIIRVRSCFNYAPINPFVGLNLAKNTDGTRSMIAVSIVRNEPFDN